MQAKKGVPPSTDQGDWLDDTDEEPDEQKLCWDINVFILNTAKPNTLKDDQNAKECNDERVVLANLVENLKLDIDDNEKIQKQLKKASASLTHEMKECKSALKESNGIRDRYRSALHHHEIELEKYKSYKDCTIEKDKVELPLERKNISKTKSVTKTNMSEGLSKPVTTQILPETTRQAVRNTNVIKPGMYRLDTRPTQTRALQLPQTSRNSNPRIFTSIGVIHVTSVSRPQLRSTHMKDNGVQNNSQVKLKKTKVEDHHRNSNFSNKKMHEAHDENLNLLCNFVDKYLGLNHNLFSAGQFCDADLEVAFRKSMCFVRDLQGNDLLTANCGSDLYTASLQ
nr:integrase, catalytic region, zinc finger, CCHC-type, peptidase aspartic, catalytic [Tanacetum cinerariifolium]